MRKYFIYLCCLALCAVMFTSCLGDDDDNITYYDDTAITAFSLGTLKYNKRVNADSVTNTTLDCSSYKFYIDQQNRTIYNTDSLPVGVDVSKVICTITTKNSGTVILRDNDSDTLFYWSSSDSVDFTQPRLFRVYNYTGAYREYTVSVNVHQQYGDTLTWSNLATVSGLSANNNMRFYATSDYLFLLGKSVSYMASRNNAITWTQISQELDNLAYNNAAVLNDTLYVLSNGKLLTTYDGQSWNESETSISHLFGASSVKLYALDANGKIASSEDGSDWTEEDLDGDSTMMPVNDASLCYMQLPTNDDTYRLLLAGNRNYSLGDTTAVVWGKIEETNEGSDNQAWSFYKFDANNPYPLPALYDLQMINYDNSFMAMGGYSTTQLNSGTQTAHGFYRSSDNGVTWQEDTTMTLPTGFTPFHPFALTADKDNYLWIADATTGTIWRGRINRLGWADEQKGFNKVRVYY